MTNTQKFLAGFFIGGATLVAATGLFLENASAQTTQKKTTTTKTVAKKPVVVKKAVVKKPVAPKVTPTPFTYAGWIPYWRKTAGTGDTYENLKYLDIVSPFSYEVTADGKLVDKLKVDQDPWPGLFAEAKAKKVKVYPTIAWFNRSAIYNNLSDSTLRAAHIAEIKQTILNNPNFDGVDIDYENKSAETKEHFSAFLKELSVETKKTNKKLICTIESRTPVDYRYASTPTAEQIADSKIVSNDFKEIGKYCDQVRIMAYDQKRYVKKLNAQMDTTSEPYSPVADTRWVEQVVKLFLKDIPANKLVLGIPTYGYKYEITQNPDGTYNYEYLRAVNLNEVYRVRSAYGGEIKRSASGELYIIYQANGQPSYMGASGTPTHMVTVSDAESIYDKIKLAKKYNLAGVSMFKFDGETDQSMWDLMRLSKQGLFK